MFFAQMLAHRRQAKRDNTLEALALVAVSHLQSLRLAQSLGMLGDSAGSLLQTVYALMDVIASKNSGNEEGQRIRSFVETCEGLLTEKPRYVVLATHIGCRLEDLSTSELQLLESKVLDCLRPNGAEAVVSQSSGADWFTLGVVFAA